MRGGAVNISFEGLDKLTYLMNNYEKPALRAVKSSLRKGANVVKKAQVASLPDSAKGQKDVIRTVSVKRELMVMAGVFSRGKKYINRRGIVWDPYQLLYWLNYGTYAGRMSGHQFVTARKQRSSGRLGGIKGADFLGRATKNALSAAQGAFEKDAQVRLDKLMKDLVQ